MFGKKKKSSLGVSKPKRKKSKKIVKRVIAGVVIAAILIGGGIYYKKRTDSKKTGNAANSGVSIVTKGSIVNSISGSGTVEPIEERDIVPLVNGKITYSPFEEGDIVYEGDVLYKFEMTSAENAIKTARNSVKSAENNVEKAQNTLSNKNTSVIRAKEDVSELTVYASESGKVSDLNIKVGDEVNGAICKITNYKEQTATIPFNAAKIKEINVGDSADIALDKYMMNVNGRVKRKYTSPSASDDGSLVYNVEIEVTDDTTLAEGIEATAVVHSKTGDINSASYGKIEYADPVTVNAKQKGKVQKINVKNGDWVDKGKVIAVLTNSDLTDALKNANQSYSEAQMSLTDAKNSLENSRSTLEDKQEAAEDYIVTSPISGVVLSKEYKTGDTVSGQNATVMMVVADMSKMKFTISVDELDISKIKIGQEVQVTADALENEHIVGRITTLSKTGTASNGVTTYPIEVTIDEPGNLLPGMNVTAEIIIEEVDNTLMLPLSAVEYFGGKYYVTVVGTADIPDFGQRGQFGNNGRNGGNTFGERPQGGQFGGNSEKPQGGQNAEKPQAPVQSDKDGSKNMFDKTENKKGSGQQGKAASGGTGMPNNTAASSGERKTMKDLIKYSGKEERAEVQVGISNDEYYEIIGGVKLGDVVKNTTQATGNQSGGMMPGFGGMPGGMGGGMPGGMGGGMPGGMRGGMPGGFGGNRIGGNRAGGGR